MKIISSIILATSLLVGCSGTSLDISKIAGTWKGYAQMEEWRDTLVLNTDKTYIYQSGTSSDDIEAGTWSVSGDKITFLSDSPKGRSETINISQEGANQILLYGDPIVSKGNEKSHIPGGMLDRTR